MKTQKSTFSALAFMLAAGMSLSLQAQQVGLWQLNGNYNSANGGDAMSEFFISGDFGSTESFAIGAINEEFALIAEIKLHFFLEVAAGRNGFIGFLGQSCEIH